MATNEKQVASVGTGQTALAAVDSTTSSQTKDHGLIEKNDQTRPNGENGSPAEQQQQFKPPALPPPPNGGLVAWVQVFCGFMLFFNTYGITNSFGVFQTFYETDASPFHTTSSNISWIQAIANFLLQFGGIIAGPLCDKGYVRHLLCLGTFCVVFGYMMLSLATQYWQALLAQGFCAGLGMGILYVPSVSTLPTYFSTRVGLAIGVASAGSAVGGVIYPVIMQKLLESVGFAWAVRVFAFVSLATLAIPIALVRQRFKPKQARSLVDWSAFTDPDFMLFSVATTLTILGIAVFLIYFSFYGLQQGLVTTDFSFSLVSIYNAMSILGRILPNALSDVVGPFNIMTPSVFFSGILFFCTISVHSKGSLIAVTSLSGFFLGVLTALPPVCFAILTKDKSRLGSRIGSGFAIMSTAMLIAGPSAGAILRMTDPLNWKGLFSFSGSAMMIATTMYATLRIKRSGIKPWVKA